MSDKAFYEADYNDNKYLIISLNHNYWDKYDHLVFWGKDSSGYALDIEHAGLYSKEKASENSDDSNIMFNIDNLNLTQDMFTDKNKNISTRINKTSKVCKYVNEFIARYKLINEDYDI